MNFFASIDHKRIMLSNGSEDLKFFKCRSVIKIRPILLTSTTKSLLNVTAHLTRAAEYIVGFKRNLHPSYDFMMFLNPMRRM